MPFFEAKFYAADAQVERTLDELERRCNVTDWTC